MVHVDPLNNKLSGELLSFVGSLTYLIFLRLSNNDLFGELSTTLQTCTNIHSLGLRGNRVSRNIPPWIGQIIVDCFLVNYIILDLV